MESFLTHLIGYNILSFRKLTYDELIVILKEHQLPMLLILTDIQWKAQMHIIVVVPSVKGDDTYHIIDGTYSNA